MPWNKPMLTEWRVWLAIGVASAFRMLKHPHKSWWRRLASAAASAGAAVALYPGALELLHLSPDSRMAPAVAAAIVLVAETIVDRLLECRTLADILRLIHDARGQ